MTSPAATALAVGVCPSHLIHNVSDTCELVEQP